MINSIKTHVEIGVEIGISAGIPWYHRIFKTLRPIIAQKDMIFFFNDRCNWPQKMTCWEIYWPYQGYLEQCMPLIILKSFMRYLFICFERTLIWFNNGEIYMSCIDNHYGNCVDNHYEIVIEFPVSLKWKADGARVTDERAVSGK